MFRWLIKSALPVLYSSEFRPELDMDWIGIGQIVLTVIYF